MRQFDVCRLHPPRGDKRKQDTLLVLILQADLIDNLDTRVVAPLAPMDAFDAIGRMRPELEVDGQRLRLIADRLSVVPRKTIGETIASCRASEHEIRRALDIVFAGV